MFGDLLGRPTGLRIWPYTWPWLIRERTAQSAPGNGAGGLWNREGCAVRCDKVGNAVYW